MIYIISLPNIYVTSAARSKRLVIQENSAGVNVDIVNKIGRQNNNRRDAAH